MKKIMFDDKYGLTKAVLEGRKTMTRRLPNKAWKDIMSGLVGEDLSHANTPYKVGEVVAVAQSYCAIVDELDDPRNFSCMEHWESKSGDRAKYVEMAMCSPGGNNKMFVLAEDMPHQIRITNVRVERMQDISDEDCIREGIGKSDVDCITPFFIPNIDYEGYLTAKHAFKALINRLAGKGTWESNPWVFVYEFELMK